jgi:hypothetical protein
LSPCYSTRTGLAQVQDVRAQAEGAGRKRDADSSGGHVHLPRYVHSIVMNLGLLLTGRTAFSSPEGATAARSPTCVCLVSQGLGIVLTPKLLCRICTPEVMQLISTCPRCTQPSSPSATRRPAAVITRASRSGIALPHLSLSAPARTSSFHSPLP